MCLRLGCYRCRNGFFEKSCYYHIKCPHFQANMIWRTTDSGFENIRHDSKGEPLAASEVPQLIIYCCSFYEHNLVFMVWSIITSSGSKFAHFLFFRVNSNQTEQSRNSIISVQNPESEHLFPVTSHLFDICNSIGANIIWNDRMGH